MLFSKNITFQTSDIPSSKSRVHLPLLRSFKNPPKSEALFRNVLEFYGGELLASRPTTKLEGLLLAGCQRLLIQYPSEAWGRATPWWQGSHLNGILEQAGKRLQPNIHKKARRSKYTQRYLGGTLMKGHVAGTHAVAVQFSASFCEQSARSWHSANLIILQNDCACSPGARPIFNYQRYVQFNIMKYN
jgi:hypothetical protein